jgi:hypothetical protein
VPLKELESWLKRGQYVRFFKGDMPPKKHTPKIVANIGAITGILLTDHSRTKMKTKEYKFDDTKD